jgi:hypothetical protein
MGYQPIEHAQPGSNEANEGDREQDDDDDARGAVAQHVIQQPGAVMPASGTGNVKGWEKGHGMTNSVNEQNQTGDKTNS